MACMATEDASELLLSTGNQIASTTAMNFLNGRIIECSLTKSSIAVKWTLDSHCMQTKVLVLMPGNHTA